MYKLCKTEESSRRQREIEEILLNLMTEKSFDDITVSEICQAASMPRKSFYRYFDGKDGIIQSILYHTMTDFQTFTSQFSEEKRTLRGEFEQFFLFWKEKSTFLEAFDKSNLIGLLVENSTNYGMSEFINISKFLPGADDKEKIHIFRFAVSGLMTLTISWYRSGFAESVPDVARTAARLISKPLFPDLDKLGIET